MPKRICIVFLIVCLLLTSSALLAIEVPFGPRRIIDSAFTDGVAIIAADLDGDSDMDVIAASEPNRVIEWWENTLGDASAWTRHTIATDLTNAWTIEAADIDGDADLDIVGGGRNTSGGNVEWWRNENGDGLTWTRRFVHATPPSLIRSLTTADIDRDGDTDIVVASVGQGIWWFGNDDGTGTNGWTRWPAANQYIWPTTVLSADMDCDGDPDLVAASGGAGVTNRINWWRSTGGLVPTWQQHVIKDRFSFSVFSTHRVVDLADFDRDGDPDVVAVSETNGISWWRNSVSVTPDNWSQQIITLAESDYVAVDAADFDCDGDADVLVASRLDQQVAWWENLGAGTGWVERLLDISVLNPRPVHAADLDGDGDADAIATDLADEKVFWWDNKTIHRTSRYPARTTLAIFTGAAFAVTVDMDKDGDADVVGSGIFRTEHTNAMTQTYFRTTHIVNWWRNEDGSGTTWTTQQVGTNLGKAGWVRTADIDRDGDWDIVSASVTNNTVGWWKNVDGKGTNWTFVPVDSAFTNVLAVAPADVNRNGTMDFAAASPVEGGLSTYLNFDGIGATWIEIPMDATITGLQCIAPADVDGDGDADFVGASDDAHLVAWWENFLGSGVSWLRRTISATVSNAAYAIPADIDRDGDIDVVSSASNGVTDITWWENADGAGGSWTTRIIESNYPGVVNLHIADLDRDGDLDIAGARALTHQMVWWESDGVTYTNWLRHESLDVFSNANAVWVEDIDGDCTLELVGAAPGGDEIAWWVNKGGQFSFDTKPTSWPFFLQGRTDDVFAITFIHRGKQGDPDAVLISLDLLFEETEGVSIVPPFANINFPVSALRMFKDKGDGVYDGTNDIFLADYAPITNNPAGKTTVLLPGGNTNLVAAVGETNVYFVVVGLRDNAAFQNPNKFFVTHLTESTSQAAYRTNSVPLDAEFSTNVGSGQITIITKATDTDGDKMPDYWEQDIFGGHTNGVATEDIDEDGFINVLEFQADSDVFDSNSFHRILSYTNGTNGIVFAFPSSTLRRYNLEYTTAIRTGKWYQLIADVVGLGGTMTLSATNQADTHRVYRIEAHVPPAF